MAGKKIASKKKVTNSESVIYNKVTTRGVDVGPKNLAKQALVANVSGISKRTANAFQTGGTPTPGGGGADINFLSPDYYHPELQPDQLLLPKSRRERNLWCLEAGTAFVLMSDGTEKAIEEINPGDSVITHRGNIGVVDEIYSRDYTGQICIIAVENLVKPLHITPNHEIYSLLKAVPEFVEAGSLSVGDKLVTPDLGSKASLGESVPHTKTISSIKVKDYAGKVYNFAVSGDDSYVVNGVAVHNCRHFYENDPIVSAAIDFHTEAPLSVLRLSPPECKDHDRSKEILQFYLDQNERIELFQRLMEITFEFNLFGNSHIFSEWDDAAKNWSNLIILDPNDVIVRKYPFSNQTDIELQIPPDIISIINNPDPRYADVLSSIPSEIVDYIRTGRNIPLDTDPYTGSHVSHIARKRSPYRNLGTSMVERVFKMLVYKDRLHNAQQSIADRNMSPKHIVTAEDVGAETLEDLRGQVEYALSDPDFAIIANYNVNWNLIGANERLLQVQSDLEYIDEQVLAGLGLTKSLITGEGTYGGDYIALEIINQRYLLFRETLTNWVENNLYKPIAFHNEFWEEDPKTGKRRLLYPKVKFNRLNLRDNSEAFNNLFNLYNKGSLDVSTILEFFHIDPIEVKDRLEKDMFTVNDPVFNDLVRSIYGEAGRALVGSTDIIDKISKYLNLQLRKDEPPGGEKL